MAEFSDRSPNILIVDRSLQNHEILKKACMEVDPRIRVIPSSDGQDALLRASKVQTDIILLEESLEKLSPKFFIQRLQELKDVLPPFYYLVMTDKTPGDLDLPDWPNIKSIGAQFERESLKQSIKDHIDLIEAGEIKRKVQKQQSANVDFINPFISATLEVLKQTCGVKAKKEKVFLRQGDVASGDISSVMAINGDHVTGSLGLAFQKRTFLYIFEKMLGEKATEITSENQDAIGEICNQVFGLAKSSLNEQGYQIKPAIPSIVVGENHRIKHLLDGVVIAVEFSTEEGNFTIEAAISS